MSDNSDETYGKELMAYPEKEQELEIKKYENYREYPVIITIENNSSHVSLDTNFAKICYDFGRFMAFNDIESEEAREKAIDFADKLVKPIQGIVYSMGDTKTYSRDNIARTFGATFINNGFFHSSEDLTMEKITELANYIVVTLEQMGHIQ